MGKLNIWLNGLSYRLKGAEIARVNKPPQSLEQTLKRAGEGRQQKKQKDELGQDFAILEG
jgi:hypothetical protein